MTKLAGEELASQADGVPDWEVVDGHHLKRMFRFGDFSTALGFVNRAGAVAEEMGHHPDMLVGWGKAEVTIWTHSVDGLTPADFELASRIQGLFKP